MQCYWVWLLISIVVSYSVAVVDCVRLDNPGVMLDFQRKADLAGTFEVQVPKFTTDNESVFLFTMVEYWESYGCKARPGKPFLRHRFTITNGIFAEDNRCVIFKYDWVTTDTLLREGLLKAAERQVRKYPMNTVVVVFYRENKGFSSMGFNELHTGTFEEKVGTGCVDRTRAWADTKQFLISSISKYGLVIGGVEYSLGKPTHSKQYVIPYDIIE